MYKQTSYHSTTTTQHFPSSSIDSLLWLLLQSSGSYKWMSRRSVHWHNVLPRYLDYRGYYRSSNHKCDDTRPCLGLHLVIPLLLSLAYHNIHIHIHFVSHTLTPRPQTTGTGPPQLYPRSSNLPSVSSSSACPPWRPYPRTGSTAAQ